jgi:acyl-CoA dehydrogenase family protein 9
VKALAATVEAGLRKYGKQVIDEQFLQKRVAEIAMNLYVQVACIARATAHVRALGAEEAEAEVLVCRAVCRNARDNVKQLLETCKHNDDGEIKKIVGFAFESGGYFLPAGLIAADEI